MIESRQALEAFDRILAHRPDRDGEAFSALTSHLCRMRDQLIASRREGADDAKLGHLNAIISLTLAGHFPLGNTPWPAIEQARDALMKMSPLPLAGEG